MFTSTMATFSNILLVLISTIPITAVYRSIIRMNLPGRPRRWRAESKGKSREVYWYTCFCMKIMRDDQVKEIQNGYSNKTAGQIIG
jgi:hypothetical protein